MTDFALGRFEGQDGPFTGAVFHGGVAAVSELLPGWQDTGIPGLLDDWDANIRRIADALEDAPAQAEADLRRLVPIVPRQLLGAGMNYRTHVIDLMVDSQAGSRPDMTPEEIRIEVTAVMDERARSGVPLVFAGLPSSITGPDDDVQLRADSDQTDWELELGAVIARDTRHVGREDALSCVAGWTIVNDLTARNFVPRKDAGPVSVDWLRSKCAPTFKPLGPYVVPSAFVKDPQDLTITLRLNGDVMQDESTADMIFDVAALIAYLSDEIQLLAGDVVMTGSPAGNGTHYGRFLRDGDVLEGEITGLGTQRNRCVGP